MYLGKSEDFDTLSGGFGLGALNDADEDDLDVYDHDQRNSRQRLAYDHINGDDDDTVVIGGRAERSKPSVSVCGSILVKWTHLLTCIRDHLHQCNILEMGVSFSLVSYYQISR